MKVTEMKTLRRMCNAIRLNRIKNNRDNIKESLGLIQYSWKYEKEQIKKV